jgi:hypothetical protein
MPPYPRRRLFRGWDWFTPGEIQHLPWRERERLTQEAWQIVERPPRYRLMVRVLPLLRSFVLCFAVLAHFLKWSGFIYSALILACLLESVIGLVWQRRHFRSALRETLLESGVRPCNCFECGYDLEGYEGNDCPACDAPLLRQADSSGSTS